MKKIPTLFERKFENHKVVGITDKITPGCEEAFLNGKATIKFDGSCCADVLELVKKHDASIEIRYAGFGNLYEFIVRKKDYKNSVILYDIDVMRDYGFEFLKQIEMMIRDIEIYISKKENSDESNT